MPIPATIKIAETGPGNDPVGSGTAVAAELVVFLGNPVSNQISRWDRQSAVVADKFWHTAVV